MTIEKTDASRAHVHGSVHTPEPWYKRGGATPGYMCIVDVNSRYIVYEMANPEQVKKDGAIGECVPANGQAGNARLMAESPAMLKVIEIIANATGDTDLEYAQEMSQEILRRLKVV